MKQLLYVLMFTVIGSQSVVAMQRDVSYKPTGQGAWGGVTFDPQVQRGLNVAPEERRPSLGDRSGQKATPSEVQALADRRPSSDVLSSSGEGSIRN